MPAVSKFAEFDTESSTNKCKICAFLENPATPPQDAAYIRDLIAQPVIIKGHTHVARVLTKGGVPISEKSVSNHRMLHVPA